MEHFADLLAKEKLDCAPMIVGVESLLNHRGFMNSPYDTIVSCFPTWKKKRNHATLFEMQEATGISKIIRKAHDNEVLDKKDVVYYFEYVLTIIKIPSENVLKNQFIIDYDVSPVKELIKEYVNELGCKIVDKNGASYIVEVDSKTIMASKITGKQYDLDKDLMLFFHPSIRNKLNQKADILCRVYKYLEGKSNQIKQYGFANMYDDTSKLMNGLDIRHAPNKKDSEIIQGMTKKEISDWYEQLFGMCVSLIILVDYAEKRKDIKELKGKLG